MWLCGYRATKGRVKLIEGSRVRRWMVRGVQWVVGFFFFQAEDGIRDYKVTGVQTCALPIFARVHRGGRLPFVHVDAYRLGSVIEVDDLDLDASVEDSVTVVEWGGGLVEQLAEIGRASCRERV